MSASPEFVDSSEKRPEKSRFSQRCSLLSQYLKENGSFGDLSLGMTCNSDGNAPEMIRQTMNFFPTNDNPQNNIRSMDLFPQQTGFSPATTKPEVQKSNNKTATSDSPKAQMTIFYNGQVIVFDDFPAEKAKELMLLAGGNGNPQVFSTNPVKSPIDCSPSVPCASNPVSSFTNTLFQDRLQTPVKPLANDLPIARRASLHRFLEKRKDRIISKAPYNINGQTSASSKPVETKSWLGLAAQPLH